MARHQHCRYWQLAIGRERGRERERESKLVAKDLAAACCGNRQQPRPSSQEGSDRCCALQRSGIAPDVRGETKVASTASWEPPYRVTSMRPSSCCAAWRLRSSIFVATAAPASRQTRAAARSSCPCVHAGCQTKNKQRRDHPTHQASASSGIWQGQEAEQGEGGGAARRGTARWRARDQ